MALNVWHPASAKQPPPARGATGEAAQIIRGIHKWVWHHLDQTGRLNEYRAIGTGDAHLEVTKTGARYRVWMVPANGAAEYLGAPHAYGLLTDSAADPLSA